MDAFNPNDSSYLGGQMPLAPGVTVDQYGQIVPLVGMPSPATNYGVASAPHFRQNDGFDPMGDIPALIETDRTFGTGYEDFPADAPYSTEPRQFEDQLEPGEHSLKDESPLLCFRQPTYVFTLLDYSLRRTNVKINARLHGMFLGSQPSPTPGLTPELALPELTCYRRNLFSIAGSITVPRSLRYILTDHGDRIPIIGQELQITATESNENAPIKLIIIPWKTAVVNNVPVMPEPKGEFPEPAIIPLDIMANQDMDADYATFPIAWKRMQFRVATANNGRRRELQQHFVLRIKLNATLSTGAKFCVAESRSNAIIVRGRSPRNFQKRKEKPVAGEKDAARKDTPQAHSPHQSPQSPHANSPQRQVSQPGSPPGQAMPPPATSRPRADTESSVRNSLKRERSGEGNAFSSFGLEYQEQWQSPQDASAGRVSDIGTPTLPSSKSTNASISPIPGSQTFLPAQPLSFNDLRSQTTLQTTAAARPVKRARTASSPKQSRPTPHARPSLPSMSSTKSFLSTHSQHRVSPRSIDSADLLYEYFPLGMDEWMPPVDAIYRPHISHHMTKAMTTGMVPMNAMASGRPGKNVRYMSDENTATAVGLGVGGTVTSSPS